MAARLILLALLLCATANAQNSERDGNWWRQEAPAARVSYVLGAIDGLSAGSFVVLSGGSEAVEAYDARRIVLLGRATVGQLCEGLDKFYADFRNRNIPVATAMCLVAVQIGGMPEKDVATWTEIYRRASHVAR